jgi:hypothetical protein
MIKQTEQEIQREFYKPGAGTGYWLDNPGIVVQFQAAPSVYSGSDTQPARARFCF